MRSLILSQCSYAHVSLVLNIIISIWDLSVSMPSTGDKQR